MEIDLALFAQRVALLGFLSGIAGAFMWQLAWAFLALLADRLNARSERLRRIAYARSRAGLHQALEPAQ
ncbi:hypothetical protein [Acidovorax sp. FJL06]|uniref:hypothetical protein n=1 Tax=Acidovorax sp. FJL06 TaxID=2153365 RepID=UPI000F568049|nr:hypothetical protein [Acidovorax sp. FJL06]